MVTRVWKVKEIGKRLPVIALAALLGVCGMAVPGAGSAARVSAASAFSDVSGHWAAPYIEKAAEKGIVSGYTDGTFQPDRSVTRAEFITMMNAALGNNGTAHSVFSDVGNSQWYYDNVCKAVAAGYINGYDDGTFGAERIILRQEAAVMMGRIVPTHGYSMDVANFYDGSDVPDWAKDAVQRIVGKEYMGTYGDNCLHPQDVLTRAQAVKIIISMTENEKIISNNQTVVQSGVVLSNMIFSNRISVGSGVTDGILTMNDCVILGTLNVEGGGTDDNGVILSNTRVANCLVRRDGEMVRISAQGESTVLNTQVDELARLETSGLSGTGSFGQGFQNVDMTRAAELTLAADLALLEIEGAKCDVDMVRGTVGNLIVYSDARKLDIVMEKGTAVTTADIYAQGAAITGKGKIETLNVYADGLTYETEPDTVSTDLTVTVKPEQLIIG